MRFFTRKLVEIVEFRFCFVLVLVLVQEANPLVNVIKIGFGYLCKKYGRFTMENLNFVLRFAL
jgi:hypothetical protein